MKKGLSNQADRNNIHIMEDASRFNLFGIDVRGLSQVLSPCDYKEALKTTYDGRFGRLRALHLDSVIVFPIVDFSKDVGTVHEAEQLSAPSSLGFRWSSLER